MLRGRGRGGGGGGKGRLLMQGLEVLFMAIVDSWEWISSFSGHWHSKYSETESFDPSMYIIGRKGKLELQSWSHATSYVKRKWKRQKIRTLHTQWINGSKITRKYETRRNTQRQEESTRSRKKTEECEGTRLYKKQIKQEKMRTVRRKESTSATHATHAT